MVPFRPREDANPFADPPEVVAKDEVLDSQRLLNLIQDDHPLCASDPVFISFHLQDITPSTFLHTPIAQNNIVIRLAMTVVDPRGFLNQDTSDTIARQESFRIHQRHASIKEAARKDRLKVALDLATDQNGPMSVTNSLIKLRAPVADIIQVKEDTDSKTWRNIVLVAQNSDSDLRIFNLIGIDLESVAPIVAILDTSRMGNHLFCRNQRHTFANGAILRSLHMTVPAGHLGAGDEAAYTMWALFGMARYAARQRNSTHGEKLVLRKLENSELKHIFEEHITLSDLHLGRKTDSEAVSVVKKLVGRIRRKMNNTTKAN